MFAPTLNKFHWQRPKALHRNYELVSGYFQIGGLKFNSSLSYEATGEFEGRWYQLKRTGLFKHKVEVFDKNSGGLVAVAETIWGNRGKLLLGDRTLHWGFSNMRRLIEIKDDRDQLLGTFKLNSWNRKTELDLNENLLSVEDRGLIALVGMYLMTLSGYN